MPPGFVNWPGWEELAAEEKVHLFIKLLGAKKKELNLMYNTSSAVALKWKVTFRDQFSGRQVCFV